MGHLDDLLMQRVNDAISVSFGLGAGYAPPAENEQAALPDAESIPAVTA